MPRTRARAPWRRVGISEASVRRIWRAHGLKPHRVEAFKISNDPEFGETRTHRRTVSQPARARSLAMRGREEPNPSAGSDPTRLAAEVRLRCNHDA
jgi:hypothetical protein